MAKPSSNHTGQLVFEANVTNTPIEALPEYVAAQAKKALYEKQARAWRAMLDSLSVQELADLYASLPDGEQKHSVLDMFTSKNP